MLIYKLIARLLLPARLGIVEDGAGGNPSAQTTEGQGAEGSGGGDPAGSAPDSSPAGGDGAQGDGTESGGDEAEETVIKLGDEELPPAEEAAPWVKDLRKRFREQAQELARLRGGQAPAEPVASLPPAPGAKPKMSDPEIDFDADKFAAAIDKWHEASRKREEAERKARDTQAQEQRAWEQTVAAYQDAGKKLGFTDFEDCEAAAIAALSPTQQAIIVQGAESADKAALIMYSLGRNMKLLQDLAKQADPVKFAFAIADIQRKLVVTKRKPTTKPEPTVPASGVSAAAALAGADKKLDELREEASRTGDTTKLLAYKRDLARKQQAKAA